MEKRRIQKIGGSSYSITLPKRWVEQTGLSEGAEVKVSPRANGALVVVPVLVGGERVVRELNLDGLSPGNFRREIVAAYLSGATEVRATGKQLTKELRKEARKSVSKLTGFEIVEETTNLILFRSLLEGGVFPFGDAMQMSFKMVHSMFSDAIKAMRDGDLDLANDTAARDHDVDKSVYVITRLAVSLLQARISEERLGVDLDFAFYCSRLARELERIADHATKIAFMTSRGQLKLSPTHIKAVAVVAEKMIPYIDNSLFLAEKLRREELHEMIDGLNAVTEDISSLSRRVAKTGRANSGLAVDSLDRLRGYLMNMAEFALERCND